MSDHDDDDDSLNKFLSENGLTSKKWLECFKDKNITTVNQIHELEFKEDCYQSFYLDATPAEIIALRKIFQIKAPLYSEDCLDRELSEVGLDVIHWSDVFKRELGIQSPQALQHVGDESYQLLAQYMRYPWERKALRKLLGMESVKSFLKAQREKQRAKLENRQAESVQLLEALTLLEKEGKDRHDEVAKDIEGKIRERLQIPKEVWLKEDTTLSQAIAQMKAMLDNTSRTLKSRDVSEVSVVEEASSGLALRGVLITRDPNDATVLRQTLLKAPNDICLDGPLHPQHEKTQQFSSEIKEGMFSERVKGFGYSASTSGGAGFGGFCLEASAGYKHSIEKEATEEEHHHEETYSSLVKYSIMPMASCSFKDHQLRLSEAALSHLQRINTVLLANAIKSIQKECEAFFLKFGSHACVGPLHFGGRFTWKCYSSGFKESDKTSVQELQKNAITTQVGLSYAGMAAASASTSVSNMTGNFKGKYSSALTSQTFIEVTITGGPPEVTGLPDWKNGLVASNSTWHLIDRGTHGVAVWEIIEMNHSSSFKNCLNFVERLKKAWQKLNTISEPKNDLIYEFESMMDGVSFWNKTYDPAQFPHRLGLLVKKKEEISKEFLTPKVWATEFLSQEPLKQFLQSVADYALQCTDDDLDSLKQYLQQLVEPIDLHITRVFPNQQAILEWLYGPNTSQIPNATNESQNALTSEFQAMMDGVSSWNKTPDQTQFPHRLSVLVAKKEEISKKSFNPKVWATDYLSQEPLKQFLRSVVDYTLQGTGDDFDLLKRYLRQLIEPTDISIFSNQQAVLKWLYGTEKSSPPIMDFLTLNRSFKHALEYMRSGIPPLGKQMMEIAVPLDYSIKATSIVAKATLSFRCFLQKSEQKYEDLFTTTMLYPFKYNPLKYDFSASMSISDLQFLCEKFEREVEEFLSIKAKGSLLSLQSYLFLLTVKLNDQFDVNEEQVKSHMKYIERKIGEEMKQELQSVLTKLRSEHDWLWFRNELGPLVHEAPIHLGDGDLLLDILEQEQTEISLQKAERLKPLESDKEMEKFFMQLHLNNQFPQRLSLYNATMIRKDTKTIEVSKTFKANTEEGKQIESVCCDPYTYPFLILQKIMAFDHRCRVVLEQKKIRSDSTKSDSDIESSSSDDEDDDIKAIIHPMDGLLALLHCSDNFLRKDLMSRLATCQLAVPLLLPDPITHKPTFLLWAMRSIITEFSNYNNTVSYAGPIIGYPAPIVSFLRLGKHSISKSGLLNAVISPFNHETFFHYDCAGGRARKVLVNGLVEVSWYLPSKNDKRLPDAITFTNLHGNASEYPEQVQFLSKVGYMHFIFLNEGDLSNAISVLKQLSEAPGGIVVLQTQSGSDLKQKMKEFIPKEKIKKINLSAKNKSEMKVSIHKRINSTLSTKDCKKLTLENCKEVARDCGIEVDEDEPHCTKGRELANEFREHINEFQKSNPGSSPKKLLVLQGKGLWQEYGEREKEKYRQTLKGHLSMYEYSGLQQDKMNQIRKRQYLRTQKLSPLMSSFLTSLLTSNGKVTWYFLHWVKMYLDDLSRELLPPLHMDYLEKKLELKAKNKIAEDMCRFEIKRLNMQLIDASFGLEHMFREIGQLYEAVMSQTDAPENLQREVSQLPKIAAQLLLDGFPLELMDGDTAHVPLKWITSVLEKLSEILEEKKLVTSTPQVFVLSVVGLQSTGKSTLLNTIFGVQFSVGAGRCTRGAFMQLLPVHESLQKRCGFQYFLLIDTEGLRAPELDVLQMQKHDSELATFVIGLSNLTVLNIRGEISGDMADVLQTAVHAFLRMNEVNLRPSCHFVYQNVPAVTARVKTMQDRFKMKEKLDAMTKEAAEQTGLQTSFRYFNDVIAFDNANDVSFFPSLWTESPPMAHVSAFYSVEAQTLKHDFIRRAELYQKSRDNSVLQLREHLAELWKAILQENFVFSFKNTYEIAAYTKLEEEYSEWSWSFKKQMDEWEMIARNDLMSCLQETLPGEYHRKKEELHTYIKIVYNKLEAEMNAHFEESRAQEIIGKWKHNIAGDLKHLMKKFERHASDTCDQLFNARMSWARADFMISRLGSGIVERIQHVASSLKRERLSEEQLKEVFEEIWVGWMPEVEPIKPPNIEFEVENSIRGYQTLKAHHKLLHQKLTLPDDRTGKPKQWGMHLQLKVRPVHLRLKHLRSWRGVLAGSLMELQFIGPAQEKTEIVFTEVRKWLTKKKDSGEDFNPNFTTELLDLLFLNISKDPSDKYDFQPEYRVEMALTVCGYAQKIFKEMSEAFHKKHNLYIETELKQGCWKQFKDNYNDIEKVKSAAEILCSQLKNPIQMQVLLVLEGVICDEMRREYKWLKSKKRLRAKVLHDIGDKLEEDRNKGKRCDFRECALYLKEPAQSLEMWIKEYTVKYCNDRGTGDLTRISKIATEVLLINVELVKKSAHEVTALLSGRAPKSSQTQGQCYINDWLHEFHGKLKGKLTLDMTKLCIFGHDAMLKSVTLFQDEVVKGLDKLHEQLREKFQTLSASVWIDHRLPKKPYDTLFEELAGCTEQCPFCKSQCDHTNANHPDGVQHSTKHRPLCLGGLIGGSSNRMALDVCTFLVDTNQRFKNQDTDYKYVPYSNYKKVYPKWDIPKEKSLPASDFWIWLVGNYPREVEACFGYRETKIYDDWKKRKWPEVKTALVKEYQEI